MADTDQSEVRLPAAQALRKLKAERNLSNRRLSAATAEVDPDGEGLSHTYIGNIARDVDKASTEALSLLARAAGVEPRYFAEVRLAAVRRLFDPREVDLDVALANLDRVRGIRLEDGRPTLADHLRTVDEIVEQDGQSDARGDAEPPA